VPNLTKSSVILNRDYTGSDGLGVASSWPERPI